MKFLHLTGVDTVIKNLDKLGDSVNREVKKGLSRGAELIKKEAIKITPKDSGTLIASAFGGKGYPVKKTVTGYETKTGFSAEYAAAVHEMPGTHLGKGTPRRGGKSVGNLWDTSGEPKFLDKAAKRNAKKVKIIIARSVKRGMRL